MLFTAGNALAGDPPRDRAYNTTTKDTMAKESDQPVSDAWITTKVKTDMMADRDVSASDISVETVNGMVKLSGRVDSKAQHDKAVALTKGIKGVKKVDSAGLMVGR
jgi:hyperosmotically inducible protein